MSRHNNFLKIALFELICVFDGALKHRIVRTASDLPVCTWALAVFLTVVRVTLERPKILVRTLRKGMSVC